MSVPRFTVTRSDSDGISYLRLTGELDLAAVDPLRRAVDDVADGQRVVVDTTDLTFIDSAGLQVLVEGRNRMGEARFTVVPGRATERLFSLAGVKEFFGLE